MTDFLLAILYAACLVICLLGMGFGFAYIYVRFTGKLPEDY